MHMTRSVGPVTDLLFVSCLQLGLASAAVEEPAAQPVSRQTEIVPLPGKGAFKNWGPREYWLVSTDLKQQPPVCRVDGTLVFETVYIDNHLLLRMSVRRHLPETNEQVEYIAECEYQSDDLSRLAKIHFSLLGKDGTIPQEQLFTAFGDKIRTEVHYNGQVASNERPWADDAFVSLATNFLVTTLPRAVGKKWSVPHYCQVDGSLALESFVIECLGEDAKTGTPGQRWTQFAVYQNDKEDDSTRFFVSPDGILQLVQLDPLDRLMLKQAGDPEPQPFQPEARQLLAEVASVYRSLPAFCAQGEYQIGARANGEWREQQQPFAFQFARPNHLHVDDGHYGMTYDGLNLLECDHRTHEFQTRQVPGATTPRELIRAKTMSFDLFNGFTGFPLFAHWELLIADDGANMLQTMAQGLWLEPDQTINGRRVRVVVADWPRGCDNRMLIDAETKRILRVELLQDPILARQLSGRPELPEESRLWWVPQTVSDESPAAETFATTPPTGYKKSAALVLSDDANSMIDEAMTRPAALKDQPLPDFEITMLEPNQKTRTFTKADLAERVAVLVLWDTTYGIEMPELSEFEKTIIACESLRDSLIFVAVSEDVKPPIPKSLRGLVERAVEQKGVHLQDHPNALLALDPSRSLVRDLHLATANYSAMPLYLVVDREGIIRFARMGVTAMETAPDDLVEAIRRICAKTIP